LDNSLEDEMRFEEPVGNRKELTKNTIWNGD
jgi:hypothetical protein